MNIMNPFEPTVFSTWAMNFSLLAEEYEVMDAAMEGQACVFGVPISE